MKVVDITFDYVMQIPLSILPLLAADFDGDKEMSLHSGNRVSNNLVNCW